VTTECDNALTECYIPARAVGVAWRCGRQVENVTLGTLFCGSTAPADGQRRSRRSRKCSNGNPCLEEFRALSGRIVQECGHRYSNVLGHGAVGAHSDGCQTGVHSGSQLQLSGYRSQLGHQGLLGCQERNDQPNRPDGQLPGTTDYNPVLLGVGEGRRQFGQGGHGSVVVYHRQVLLNRSQYVAITHGVADSAHE